jgi:hypothetical protein
MLLETYLIGASVHFLMNIYTLEVLVKRHSLARDRSLKNSTSKEINAYANSLPMCLVWPVDFASRAWAVIKLRP